MDDSSFAKWLKSNSISWDTKNRLLANGFVSNDSLSFMRTKDIAGTGMKPLVQQRVLQRLILKCKSFLNQWHQVTSGFSIAISLEHLHYLHMVDYIALGLNSNSVISFWVLFETCCGAPVPKFQPSAKVTILFMVR